MKQAIQRIVGFGVLLIARVAFAADPPPQYVLTDLGSYNFPYAINNLGQVVGKSQDGSGNTTPFLYSNGVMQDLGSLGGFIGSADSINDAGQIVGWSAISPADSSPLHAFLINGSGAPMQDIGLNPVVTYQRQYAINSSGQITGPNGYASVIYSNGVIQQTFRLPLQSGVDTTEAAAINSHGVVAGAGYNLLVDHQQGFLYSKGSFTLLADASVYANGINDSGSVVGGLSLSNSAMHAYVYDGTTTRDLGVLGTGGSSDADAINSVGDIVGWSDLSDRGPQHAFVVFNGTMYDLNSLTLNMPAGTALFEATAINDSGDIVGIMANGTTPEAFLLTPVPEPVLLGICVFSCVALLARPKPRIY